MTSPQSGAGDHADKENLDFETRAIHVGQDPDPTTRAIIPPVSFSTTFVQTAAGEYTEYDYSRADNPTRTVLQTQVASLEGARYGYAFASGQAAEDTVLRLLKPGAHVIFPHDAYGGTYRLLAKVFEPAGGSFTPVNYSDDAKVDSAWRDETKMVWIETPSNPLLAITDIQKVSLAAHERGALVVVDNTFATPYLQTPLALGADIVIHSSSKYLGGHSDVIGGFVATNDSSLADRIKFLQKAVGAVPGPLDCYLLSRGVKTLAVRMDRHCENASAIAELLVRHPAVDKVHYPGLPTHAGHDVARRQMRNFGGMVSFTVGAGEQAALKLVTKTHLFKLAESLGAVESLIEHPAKMTHVAVAGSELEIDPALIRLSVGIESADDLLSDLASALDLI